jgi:hypothetical protein
MTESGLSNDQKRTLAKAALAQAAQVIKHWDSVVLQDGYAGLGEASKDGAAQVLANWLGYLPGAAENWPAEFPQPSRRSRTEPGQSHPAAGTAAMPVDDSTGAPEAQNPASGPHLDGGNVVYPPGYEQAYVEGDHG